MSLYSEPIPRLRRVLGFQATMDGWNLSSLDVGTMTLNRQAVAIAASNGHIAGTDAQSRFVSGFRWADGDYASTSWMPQGLSGTGDAYASGIHSSGKRMLVATWHHSDAMAMVSFVDLATLTYRHALLVEPYEHATRGPSWRDVAIHAGGVVWYGDLLFVADTFSGLRVFDVSQLKSATLGSASLVGKQSDGTFMAHNFGTVCPQVARYTQEAPFSAKYSFCGLDREATGGVSLMTGTYDTAAHTRLYWWPLADEDLETASDICESSGQALVTDFALQGGISLVDHNGELTAWYATSGTNRLRRRTIDLPAEDATFTWPNLPEGVTYFPASDELWTATEPPSARIVFAVHRSDV